MKTAMATMLMMMMIKLQNKQIVTVSKYLVLKAVWEVKPS